MSLILPTFRDRKCSEIGFCAAIHEEDTQGLPTDLEELKEPIYARYQGDGRECIAVLVPPFLDDEKKHVHLHVMAGEKQAEPVEPDPDLDKILALIAPVMNRKLKVAMRGTFKVSKDEVPPFISSAVLQSFSDKVSVKMIGGKIAVQGAPIDTLSWELTPKGNARIYLEARMTMMMDDGYLDKGIDLLEDVFASFTAQEPKNV